MLLSFPLRDTILSDAVEDNRASSVPFGPVVEKDSTFSITG
jgi:hypothetical protein